MGPFIADFVCYSRLLILELDGSHHGDDARDGARDDWFVAKGFSKLRIWNSDLTDGAEAVSDAVWHRLKENAHGQ
ncbi:DUF559 domain-containing protein [Pelagibacterium limicola]|uniref:DUF559 domain-containing protein n=1 Tax=Pelagibacterium limicola TaxID=2791022 RepID=UPI0018AF9736|nr:DUF559 domain-containing protein [Pelagibacterium limicola]